MKLDGVKVLDLSLFLPGPMLTLMMADHGADVIKIEPVGEGEPSRHIGLSTNGQTVWFRNTHRGKRSVQLDLKSAQGQAAFWTLAKEADVLVEAFRPGVVDRLGVGYEAVKAVNPGIVYCSISAFGQTGPYRDRPAHDLAVEALAGLVALNEGQDGKPAMPGLMAADALASLTALSGVLMALYRRTQTGLGDHLDVAMLDSLMAWTPNATGPVFAQDRANVPKAERSWGGAAMFNLYECRDGRWIVLGGSEVKFAAALLEALGRSDLLDHARQPPGPGQEPLRVFFRETFITRTQAEWEAWFEGRDICFAPVRTLKEAFADPAVAARGMIWRDAAGNAVVGTPLLFRQEPGRPDPKAPGLDEHAGQVWRTLS
ncbi:CaiB/BaiF CoA transferase family protein [Caulobacter sp. DWR3-1-2]|uniref:CaiB/BaiF CoA transferase family protein n=1 Tax=Caulobacter sp. DWR3-1-2 TaxID=2804647 RepID=UPI003CEC1AEE